MKKRVVYLPLWAQMTMTILVVCLTALIIISLVVGIHTWAHGRTLVRNKLETTSSMYAHRLQNSLLSTISSFKFAMKYPVVTEAIRAHNPTYNTSISEESRTIYDLSQLVTSVVNMNSTYSRGVFISDSSLNQIYSLILSDETASLSAVLASLQELTPILQPDFSYEDFGTEDCIITAPVLTVPTKGTPFFSLSITVPISSTKPFFWGLEGYATLVIDADRLADSVMSGFDSYFKDGDTDLFVIGTENNKTGFRFAATNSDPQVSRSNRFYQLSHFSAVAGLANYNTTVPITQSDLHTKTLNLKEASTACSVVSIYNIKWVLCLETTRSEAFQRVVSLRNKVIGLSIGMIGLVLLMVIPTGRVMTAPLYTIYSQMETPGSKDGPKPPPPNLSRRQWLVANLKWLAGVGLIKYPQHGPPEKTPTADDESEEFKVPHKIQPFDRRFYHDELDRLVTEYNELVEELNNQYYYLEDQVKGRTMEAQEARVAAEKANAAKSQFIANITHELRTPLNGIMGMTSVTLTEESIPKVRVALEIILKSGRTLMKLLNELLAFSKSQVDMEPKLSEFTAADILENLENMFKARSDSEKAEVLLTFDTLCEPAKLRSAQFLGDGHRISQICLHLMSNAIKFTSSGDHITAAVRYNPDQSERVNVTPYSSLPVTLSQMGTLEISIVDSGKGIDETQLASVFEPFVQGDDAFTKKYDGTGLGMSMCKQLATTIGASVEVWSAHRKGTFCVIEVPVVAPDGQGAAAAITSPPANRNRNGMLYTSSGTPGTVSRYQLDPHTGARISFLSVEDCLYDTVSASNSAAAQVTEGQTSIKSDNTSQSNRKGGHTKKKSLVSSIFSGFLRPQHNNSQPSLRSSPTRPSFGAQKPEQPSSADHSRSTSLQPTEISDSQDIARSASPHSSFNEMPVAVRKETKQTFLAHAHPDYKVLVADDNALNLEIMVKMLNRIGITDVHTATDGEAVVQLVEKSIKLGFHYSVIFMDLSMPQLNGFQATNIIRRTLGYPYPIVALTGYSDQRTKRLCDSHNIQEILVKPVLRDSLVSVLAKYDSPSSQELTELVQ